MDFFSNAKDRLIETMVLPILNRSFLAPYGRARSFMLNSLENDAEILLELKGDPAPIRVRIGGYEFHEEDGETFLVIHAVDTTREWMTDLAGRSRRRRPSRPRRA